MKKMEYCPNCTNFENWALSGKTLMFNERLGKWEVLHESGIQYPGIPTMNEYKTINYCPFCGYEFEKPKWLKKKMEKGKNE